MVLSASASLRETFFEVSFTGEILVERTRWEYKVVRSDDLPANEPEDRDRLVGRDGGGGWEMVSVDWNDAFASDKRPREPR